MDDEEFDDCDREAERDLAYWEDQEDDNYDELYPPDDDEE